MRPTLSLLLPVLLGLTTPASSAQHPSQVCHRIAGMLATGAGNNAGQGRRQSLLEALAHNSHGRLQLVAWRSQGSRRAAYLRAANLQNTKGGPMTAALRADRLVAVMDVQGSSGCGYVTLLRTIGHQLVQMVPPYVVRGMSCSHWGDATFLGSLDGQAFAARETDDATRIQFAPWNGHSWNSVCSDVVRYVPKLTSEGPFCRAADCSGAEAEARRIAGLVHLDETQGTPYQTGSNPALDHLVELAGHTLGTDTMPALPGQPENGFTSFLAPFLAKVDGRPTLAMASVWKESPAGDGAPIGYAVAFWQETGDKLKPIASFHLRTAHSTIRSVSVTR